MKPSALIVIAIVLFMADKAFADFYCKDKLISPGDSTAGVLLACGEPFLRETIGIVYSGAFVEQWTYVFPGQFLKILTVAGGRVTKIRKSDERYN